MHMSSDMSNLREAAQATPSCSCSCTMIASLSIQGCYLLLRHFVAGWQAEHDVEADALYTDTVICIAVTDSASIISCRTGMLWAVGLPMSFT